MRAIPALDGHRQTKRQGWMTCRIIVDSSLGHMRQLVRRSRPHLRQFPHRSTTKFSHVDGSGCTFWEYANGCVAKICDERLGPARHREGGAGNSGITWRVEGTLGMARGTIGCPSTPPPLPQHASTGTTTAKRLLEKTALNEAWLPRRVRGPDGGMLGRDRKRTPNRT